MTYTYEIYNSEYGKGFRIYLDGVLFIEQPFKPGVEGFVGMSEQEAIQEAEKMIYSLENPPTILTRDKLLTSEQVNFLKSIDSNVIINTFVRETITTIIQFSRKLTDEELNNIIAQGI